jgi:hypothetical protein
LFSVRSFFLSPGTIGHNWDWSIPTTPDALLRYGIGSAYTWSPNFLGTGGTVISPLQVFLGTLGALGLGGDLVSRILVVATITLSGSFMYLLASYVLASLKPASKGWKTSFGAFMSGFCYAFSPFLYNDLIGGAVTQFFTYAVLPIVIFSLRNP